MSLAMSRDEREQFLAGLHVGIVSIARGKRAPLTVPIWYDYMPGGEAWMITGSTSLKGRALAKVERISLCAQSEAPPYRYVSIAGAFTTRPAQPEDLLHMAIRYLGEEQGRQYAASSQGDDSVVVSITPDAWLSVDYGKR